MKLNIEVPDAQIWEVVEGSSISYWTTLAEIRRKRGKKVLRIEESDADERNPITRVLTLADFKRGLELMAVKHPKHFANAIRDAGWDSETGDVLIQYAMFGEIKYG